MTFPKKQQHKEGAKMSDEYTPEPGSYTVKDLIQKQVIEILPELLTITVKVDELKAYLSSNNATDVYDAVMDTLKQLADASEYELLTIEGREHTGD